jgi:hypothetical protein
MNERLYLSGRLKVPRNRSVGTVVSTVQGRMWMATAMVLTLASWPAGSQSAGSAVASASRPVTNSATYEAVLEGMACKQHKSGRMDCDYRVGGAARFVIAGVGQEDVVVSFVQADSSAEYTASFVPLHGCVVVKPARPAEGTRASQAYTADSVATFAFVSPRTGRVYHTWATCLSATRPEARVDAKAEGKPDATNAPPTKVVPPTKAARSDTAKPAAPRKPPPR